MGTTVRGRCAPRTPRFLHWMQQHLTPIFKISCDFFQVFLFKIEKKTKKRTLIKGTWYSPARIFANSAGRKENGSSKLLQYQTTAPTPRIRRNQQLSIETSNWCHRIARNSREKLLSDTQMGPPSLRKIVGVDFGKIKIFDFLTKNLKFQGRVLGGRQNPHRDYNYKKFFLAGRKIENRRKNLPEFVRTM